MISVLAFLVVPQKIEREPSQDIFDLVWDLLQGHPVDGEALQNRFYQDVAAAQRQPFIAPEAYFFFKQSHKPLPFIWSGGSQFQLESKVSKTSAQIIKGKGDGDL